MENTKLYPKPVVHDELTQHIILFAKCHYGRTNDIINDFIVAES